MPADVRFEHSPIRDAVRECREVEALNSLLFLATGVATVRGLAAGGSRSPGRAQASLG